MISYAQNFEDVVLARLFAGRNSGFYVDVGAADPVNLSVTKWFYDLGWSGLNIEPNKQLFDRLAAHRSRDINLNCGAGATTSEAPFFEPDVGELSSFDSRVQDKAQSNGVPGSMRTVAVAPLTCTLRTPGLASNASSTVREHAGQYMPSMARYDSHPSSSVNFRLKLCHSAGSSRPAQGVGSLARARAVCMVRG